MDFEITGYASKNIGIDEYNWDGESYGFNLGMSRELYEGFGINLKAGLEESSYEVSSKMSEGMSGRIAQVDNLQLWFTAGIYKRFEIVPRATITPSLNFGYSIGRTSFKSEYELPTLACGSFLQLIDGEKPDYIACSLDQYAGIYTSKRATLALDVSFEMFVAGIAFAYQWTAEDKFKLLPGGLVQAGVMGGIRF